MKSGKILILVSIVMVTFIYSCSSYIIKENDISYLSPNFFNCDSVKSTPVSIKFKWSPKSNDSVLLKISGDICSGIRLQSGWIKDSIIALEFDAKKTGFLSFDFSFSLSEKCYDVIFSASISGYELINRDAFIFKDSLLTITKYNLKIYLPLYRFNTFAVQQSNFCIGSVSDKKEIKTVPYFDEDLSSENSLTITDFLEICVDSDLPVALYDKSINKIVGKEVIARVNDLSKYQVCLLENSISTIYDSVLISFCNGAFVNNYKMFMSSDCFPPNKIPDEIIVRIGDGSVVHPGDTVNVYVTYLDVNGVEHNFNNNTNFEAGLISGCSITKILSKDGELKKYFRSIMEPIKLVILEYNDDDLNDNHVWLRVGLTTDNFIDSSTD